MCIKTETKKLLLPEIFFPCQEILHIQIPVKLQQLYTYPYVRQKKICMNNITKKNSLKTL